MEDPDARWEKSQDALLKIIDADEFVKLGIRKTLYANMIYELAMWKDFTESEVMTKLKLNVRKLWLNSIKSLREKHFSILAGFNDGEISKPDAINSLMKSSLSLVFYRSEIFEKQRSHSRDYKSGGDDMVQITKMLEEARLADAIDEALEKRKTENDVDDELEKIKKENDN